MTQHNLTSPVELQAAFEARLLAHVAARGRTPIVWEETYAAIAGSLPGSTLVEVWSNRTLLDEAIARGFPVLLADGWYLDRQVPVDNKTQWFWQDTWEQFYMIDIPSAAVGGEANMWGEQVNVINACVPG
jgi:hypothetical protein